MYCIIKCKQKTLPPKRSLSLEIHSSKNTKRNPKYITLETKLEVLLSVDDGEQLVQICSAMALAESTVNDRGGEI